MLSRIIVENGIPEEVLKNNTIFCDTEFNIKIKCMLKEVSLSMRGKDGKWDKYQLLVLIKSLSWWNYPLLTRTAI